jgi:hypothetical protein
MVGGFPGSHGGLTWADVPVDVQLYIIAFIPLADLARMAGMGKSMRAAYRERLKERETCIEARLAVGWPREVTKGLSAADMAVPRDLIDTPPVRPLLLLVSWACLTMTSRVG